VFLQTDDMNTVDLDDISATNIHVVDIKQEEATHAIKEYGKTSHFKAHVLLIYDSSSLTVQSPGIKSN